MSLMLLTKLNLSMLLILHAFLSSVDFFKINFFKKSFRNVPSLRVSNSLGPDQDIYFVRPNLGPNCLQGYRCLNSLL